RNTCRPTPDRWVGGKGLDGKTGGVTLSSGSLMGREYVPLSNWASPQALCYLSLDGVVREAYLGDDR
ncbi:uncharacterized protein METZ01_LOCUS328392, partial [marine metagenome]